MASKITHENHLMKAKCALAGYYGMPRIGLWSTVAPSKEVPLVARIHMPIPNREDRMRIHAAGRRGFLTDEGRSSLEFLLPESKDDAVGQATDALITALSMGIKNVGKTKGMGSGRAGNKSAKGNKKSNSNSRVAIAWDTRRLVVDIPVQNDSVQDLVQLAEDLACGLPQSLLGSSKTCTIIVCGENNSNQERMSTPKSDARVMGLLDAVNCLSSGQQEEVGSATFLVGPKVVDLELLEKFFSLYNGQVSIMLNPEWSPSSGDADGGVPDKHTAFVKSLQSAYCFLPILVKGLMMMSPSEGVVYNNASLQKQKRDQKSWKILLQSGGSFQTVAQMARRPSQVEVEATLYNALGATSPLTRGAKALKNIFPGQQNPS